MTTKDQVAVEQGHVEQVPIEHIMYHESKHLNVEAVDEVQAERKPWELGDGFDKKQDRRLLFKIDIRLIPILGVIYGMSVIDRINIGQAQVAGMREELGLTIGARYSVCLLLFFPGYTIFELPSNMALVRFGVKWTMTFLIVAWGLIVMGMGFVNHWGALAALRFFLGVFEAGIFPGCVYLIGSWYQRYEVHKRIAGLYTIGLIASAFAGILAYAISKMDGQRGYRGWRWIFILEGVITVAIGMVSPLFLIDFPDKSKFMKPAEKEHVINRLNIERGDGETHNITRKLLWHHLGDWTMWWISLVYLCNVGPIYSLAYFVPTILAGLGYSSSDAIILGAPPYIAALGLLWGGSYLADRFQKRVWLIVAQACLCITGLALVMPGPSVRVRFLGTFFAVMGAQCNTPAIITFQQNNVVGSSKRSVAAAMNIGSGAIGGIIGSTIFRAQDAPFYRPGMYATIGMQCFLIMGTLFITSIFWMRNRAAERNNTPIQGVMGWRYTL